VAAIGYPACAGIDLFPVLRFVPLQRLPRMRGDRPANVNIGGQTLMATPHARGSTRALPQIRHVDTGYPACAGIDLFPRREPIRTSGLPRMRGDRPIAINTVAWTLWATPHARGSTAVSALKLPDP